MRLEELDRAPVGVCGFQLQLEPGLERQHPGIPFHGSVLRGAGRTCRLPAIRCGSRLGDERKNAQADD